VRTTARRYFVVFGVFTCLLFICAWIGSQSASEAEVSAEASMQGHVSSELDSDKYAAVQTPPPVPTSVIKGSIRRGETFYSALAREKLERSMAAEIIKGFSKVINFRKCKPGDSFCLSLDADGGLIRCTYEKGPFEVYALERDPDCSGGYRVVQDDVVLERHVIRLSEVIDSSLVTAFSKAGADDQLTLAFAEVFSSKIDFNTETRSGDQFEVLFEKYFKEGEFVGYGRILAARYTSACEELEAYFYTPEGEGKGNYYDHDGQGLGTYFLRSPLPVYRVTSKFTGQRLHPILKVYRPHYGVDLAAPIGTPVMAAADGTVNFAGWQNGFGRTIVLKHQGGFKTYYGHLSRLGKGIVKGAKVAQKQVIGYVGSSGLSTGPHLDYRVSQNGVFKNPFGMAFKPESRLAGGALDDFIAERAALDMLLGRGESTEILVVETKKIHGKPDGWQG
jgi:murein DD-endopeptidase MepM/ murein hydrolase activator NlpD